MKDRKANQKDVGRILPSGSNEPTKIMGNGGEENDESLRTGTRGRIQPDTTVVIHEQDLGAGIIRAPDQYLANRGIVHRAMHLLEGWKFMTARISSAKVPVDIIALRKDMAMLVQEISSRYPAPNAKILVKRYATKIDDLRRMGTTFQFRKVLVAHSLPCGWKHYDVLPGGLVPAWDLMKMPVS